MYTIKHAAELTGVTEATLRAWERRYGLVAPRRTDGGYRVYSEADLRIIRDVAALIEQGWTASLAAREVRQSEGAVQASGPDRGRSTTTATSATTPRARGLPFVSGDEATGRLVAAARAIDPSRVGAVLDEKFAVGGFEHVIDSWLLPTLVEVGRAWASGRMSVAGEHLVAHAVHRRIAAAFDAARSGGGQGTVVVGLPAGVHHELGLFAFAVALRRAGLDVIHLGPDVPIDAWRAALDVHGARAAVTAAPMADDVLAARSVVRGIARSHPDVLRVVGGGQQDSVTGRDLIRPGHLIGPAAATVASLVGERVTSPPRR